MNSQSAKGQSAEIANDDQGKQGQYSLTTMDQDLQGVLGRKLMRADEGWRTDWPTPDGRQPRLPFNAKNCAWGKPDSSSCGRRQVHTASTHGDRSCRPAQGRTERNLPPC